MARKKSKRETLDLFSNSTPPVENKDASRIASKVCTFKKEDYPMPSYKEVLTGGINRCVSWYLVHSYLYYRCHTSIIPDPVFDAICARLYGSFDKITHPHKCLLSKENLAAGSAFDLEEDDYPTIVKNTAFNLIDKSTPLGSMVV